MIEEIKFLYVLRSSSIYREFLNQLESIMTYCKLLGFELECERKIFITGEEYIDQSVDNDWILFIGDRISVEFNCDEIRLKDIEILDGVIKVNDGSEEDFLISMEILKGLIMNADT